MVDIDDDKDRIIRKGRSLAESVDRVSGIFECVKYELSNFCGRIFSSRHFLRESRREYRIMKERFREYNSECNKYFDDVTMARNLVVSGQVRAWGHEDRQKAHIFSEQIKMQRDLLFESLRSYKKDIENFEQDLANHKMLYLSAVLLVIAVLTLIITWIKP